LHRRVRHRSLESTSESRCAARLCLPRKSTKIDMRQRHKQESAGKISVVTSNGIEGEEQFKVLASAPPPWHSVLLVFTFVVIFMWRLPNIALIDEIADREVIAKSLSGLSSRQIAAVRLVFACIIWGTSISCLISNGWDVTPPYVQRSKLKRNSVLRLNGIKTLWPFTSW
jgi:hypothetical protein